MPAEALFETLEMFPDVPRSPQRHLALVPELSHTERGAAILNPGFNLTLRPMKYPNLYDMFVEAIRASWTVEEIQLTDDIADLNKKLTPAERHMVQRLVAFFATGDSIVSNNLVLNLYKHINSPEARLFLSRQLFEEAQHVQFYLTLLDTYVTDPGEREAAFAAVENIESIRLKAEFCQKWIGSLSGMDRLETKEDRRQFVLNLICFAACVEGLFFFGAFAYVYFLRSKGLLNGLALGTNWVFADESSHMDFAFAVLDIVREDEPDLFDGDLEARVVEMMREAIACETVFAEDLLSEGILGINPSEMRRYLESCADDRLTRLGFSKVFGATNPFGFMDLQGVRELTNFFERGVSAYQSARQKGKVLFDEDY